VTLLGLPPEPISASPPTVSGRIVASQVWRDVVFLHWPADPQVVAPLLPAGVAPDVAEGSTWVGLIGFELDRARLAGGPPVPFFGRFAEINVRLYGVDLLGRRGVVFRSLDASRLAAVLAARVAFSLPYRWASTSIVREGSTIGVHATPHLGGGSSRFSVERGDVVARPSPLEDFLTARWALFQERFGRTLYLPNTHERWDLRRARVTELEDDLVARAGIDVSGPPVSVLVSPGVTARFGRGSLLPVRAG
jgi:uncharacterized protein YqjF (DUF2071 family)